MVSFSLKSICFFYYYFAVIFNVVSSRVAARLLNEDEFFERNRFTTKAPKETPPIHDELIQTMVIKTATPATNIDEFWKQDDFNMESNVNDDFIQPSNSRKTAQITNVSGFWNRFTTKSPLSNIFNGSLTSSAATEDKTETEFLNRNQFTTEKMINEELSQTIPIDSAIVRSSLNARQLNACSDGYRRDHYYRCREIVIEDFLNDMDEDDEY